jgi:hypothetical protein
MKKVILFIYVILLSSSTYSQIKERGLGVHAGYSYQNISSINLGVNYMFVRKNEYIKEKTPNKTSEVPSQTTKYSLYSHCFSLSGHMFFPPATKTFFGQSISYNFSKTWNSGLGGGGGLALYNFSHNDYRFAPIIGLSFADIISIQYSYLVSINNNEQKIINPNQINIVLRYNKALYGAILNILK